MATFLQLGQFLQLECGVSGTLSTMQGQTGSLGRLVAWTNLAWQQVQTEHDDWEWMRSSNLLGGGCSFVTVAGQASYPLGTGIGKNGVLLANFGKWVKDSFRNYQTAAGFSGEIFMDEIDYEMWRNGYMYGAQRVVQTRPVAVAIGPDKSVCVGPPSDGTYTVTGDYYAAPTLMVNDTDIPVGIPAAFQYIIVYKAMLMYAGYESAPEVQMKAQAGWNQLLAQMEANYLPEMSFAGSL
jgi:hypothetical protein